MPGNKECPSCCSATPLGRTSKPWLRLPIDFFDPFCGKMFFILVNAHSKWPEIQELSSTIHKNNFVLKRIFAAYGLPLSCLTYHSSREKCWQAYSTCPVHSSSNRLEEHYVKTFKHAMRAGDRSGILAIRSFPISF